MSKHSSKRRLRDCFATEADYRAMVDLWRTTKPAQETPDWFPWAIEGCEEIHGIDPMAICSKEDLSEILIAAFNVESEGETKVRQEAADKFMALAIAGGWEDLLYGPPEEIE